MISVMERDIHKIIDRLSKNELQFIVKLFIDNVPVCKSLLYSRYVVGKEKSQINRLKSVVDNLIIEYADRDGFIDYRHAWEFSCKIVDVIEDNMELFLQSGNYNDAFELIIYIINVNAEVEMDDSDGGCTIINHTCFENLSGIINQCDEVLRKKIFTWLLDYNDNGVGSESVKEYVENLIRDEFDTTEECKQKIIYYDAKIEEFSKKYEKAVPDYYYYNYETYVFDRISVMHKLNYSEVEINTYKNKFRFMPKIRRIEIGKELVEGHIDSAIELLKESKVLDCAKPGLVKSYSEQLIHLYEKIGKMDLYKKELESYIYSNYHHDFIYIDMLKAISSEEEWKKIREDLIQERLINKLRFMEREGMYERMILELEKSFSIYDLKDFENVLKDRFPERIRNLYVSYVQEEVKTTGNRGKYRELALYLKKIKEYDGGEKIVSEIVKQWKEAYKKRSAMMNELVKAGF